MKRLTETKLRKTIRSMIRRQLLNEKATAAGVDSKRFPLTLSSAGEFKGPMAALYATGGGNDGDDDDDIVDSESKNWPVTDLKPSQTSMSLPKAVAFALMAIAKKNPFPNGPGGELGAIITSDGHIMDGHHRWIATAMVDPTAEISGATVDFPAKEMIAALNMVTVHLTGRKTGKAGKGSFANFVEADIISQLQEYVKTDVWKDEKTGDTPMSGQEVIKYCEEFAGSKGDAAVIAAGKKMALNIAGDAVTKTVPDGFPKRKDMPVLSPAKNHVKQALELLQQGKVDLNEPYAPNPAESELKADGVIRTNNVILERWNKLAGLLK